MLAAKVMSVGQTNCEAHLIPILSQTIQYFGLKKYIAKITLR